MTRSVSVTTAVRLQAPMIKSPHRVAGFATVRRGWGTVRDGSDVTEWAAVCLFTAAAGDAYDGGVVVFAFGSFALVVGLGGGVGVPPVWRTRIL